MAFCQGVTTLFLVAYDIDVSHKLPLAICQFGAAYALIIQWRTDRESMFVVRAAFSVIRALLLIHLGSCGRVSPWQDCDHAAWSDIRRPFRLLHFLAAARMFLNGLSLFLQWAYPKRGMTLHYGHEQLFVRGCIRGMGSPLFLARALQKLTDLTGTEYERTSIEIATDLLRAVVFIPMQSWSLLHQWRYTGLGADKSGRYSEVIRNKDDESEGFCVNDVDGEVSGDEAGCDEDGSDESRGDCDESRGDCSDAADAEASSSVLPTPSSAKKALAVSVPTPSTMASL
eukprot:TRINITY_DN97484_c0_g1_i1.p1 TRINITY_DN97484_c0_g1~~TRINITY_DN97484_c0_g1_i1.p1  ORF type:complete len:294 (-),score=33.51 TRINITY_DN97484_c0_g1_i1:105-959(-)